MEMTPLRKDRALPKQRRTTCATGGWRGVYHELRMSQRGIQKDGPKKQSEQQIPHTVRSERERVRNDKYEVVEANL